MHSGIKCEIVNNFSYMHVSVEIILGNETFIVRYIDIPHNFSNKKCIICGDFNLNLLALSSNIIESFKNVNF